MVRIVGRKLDILPVRVELHQGCFLSLILFIIFLDRISRCFNVEGIWVGDLRIRFLLFADVVVLLTTSFHDLECCHLRKAWSKAPAPMH